MKFQRKFGKQRQSKPGKGLLLVVVLIIVIILWYKAEAITNALF
jgi:hypothetical protein